MKGSLVVKLNNTTVYLINDSNISYYLSVPNNKTNKVNIAINIMEGLNNSNVSSIYSLLDNYNLCLISPIFQNNIYLGLTNANEQVFAYTDKCISYLINAVYKIISANNISIDSKIKLIKNNSFTSFEDWFSKRYESRVEVFDYQKTKPTPNTPINTQLKENTISNETPSTDQTKATDVLNNIQDIETNIQKIDTPPEGKDLGFVSYVLLGVVVAVISLVLLYLLI